MSRGTVWNTKTKKVLEEVKPKRKPKKPKASAEPPVEKKAEE